MGLIRDATRAGKIDFQSNPHPSNMCNSRGASASLGCSLLLLLLTLEACWAASILHHSHDSSSATAISHQSFVRLPTQRISPLATPTNSELSTDLLPLPLPAQHSSILATPTVRIINTNPQLRRELTTELAAQQLPLPLPLQLNAHTPAELTYAAHPVVHQMLPRIKPVRNLSYAELRPTARRERERHTKYAVYAH